MPNYNYFSGANVVIRVGGQPVLEVAGISYQETDSQMPIYGYGSRYFDAVSPGQKLIRGNFVINFVRPDYLAFAIARGRDIEATGISGYEPGVNVADLLETSRANSKIKNKGNTSVYQSSKDTYQRMQDEATSKAISSLGESAWNKLSDSEKVQAVQGSTAETWIQERGNALWEKLDRNDKAKFLKLEAINNISASNYRQTSSSINKLATELKNNMPSSYSEQVYGIDSGLQLSTKVVKDITMNTAFNIDIVFGQKYVIKLLDCYITSRGSMIQIDEGTIVEEYGFFARNMKTLRLDNALK